MNSFGSLHNCTCAVSVQVAGRVWEEIVTSDTRFIFSGSMASASCVHLFLFLTVSSSSCNHDLKVNRGTTVDGK